MKSLFRNLCLSMVLVSTTFCSKEHDNQVPAPKATVKADNYAGTFGFNSQRCAPDTAGTQHPLFVEARNNTTVSDAEFAAIKAEVSATVLPTAYNGRISTGSPYDTRINRFSDDVYTALRQHDDYLYYCQQAGRPESERTTYLADVIRQKFESNIANNADDPYLTPSQKEGLTAVANAVRPQMERALNIYLAMYPCESTLYRSSTTTKEGRVKPGQVTASQPVLTFEQYLELRKAGKIKAPVYGPTVEKSRFWRILKSAVHVAVSVVWSSVVTAASSALLATQKCPATGPLAPACLKTYVTVGAAVGFVQGLNNVIRGKCLFGPC